VIIDSYGSPTIASDLHTFDAAYGLPDPPSFQVIAPLGTVPFDSTDPVQLGWAGETTLDVEWAHAIAPGANIVLLTSPVAETQGVPGMPQFLELEQYALDHKLGKIISQSWGTPENDLFASPDGVQVLTNFENFFARAAKENVTVLASASDTGSTGYELNGVDLFPMPVVNFPASCPWSSRSAARAFMRRAKAITSTKPYGTVCLAKAAEGSASILRNRPISKRPCRRTSRLC
jgi:subtilase family serine protease